MDLVLIMQSSQVNRIKVNGYYYESKAPGSSPDEVIEIFLCT
jgi:hypothetical protein